MPDAELTDQTAKEIVRGYFHPYFILHTGVPIALIVSKALIPFTKHIEQTHLQTQRTPSFQRRKKTDSCLGNTELIH